MLLRANGSFDLSHPVWAELTCIPSQEVLFRLHQVFMMRRGKATIASVDIQSGRVQGQKTRMGTCDSASGACKGSEKSKLDKVRKEVGEGRGEITG